MNFIYRCLSSYFTDIWQVFLSICLSDTFHTGVWLTQLKDFSDYMKRLSGDTYTITDTTAVTSMDEYTFLTRNHAQCDFTTLRALPVRWYKVNNTSYMYDSLYKNLQSVETDVRGAERADKFLEKKGGKSRKRKRKSRKITTKSRYV